MRVVPVIGELDYDTAPELIAAAAEQMLDRTGLAELLGVERPGDGDLREVG